MAITTENEKSPVLQHQHLTPNAKSSSAKSVRLIIFTFPSLWHFFVCLLFVVVVSLSATLHERPFIANFSHVIQQKRGKQLDLCSNLFSRLKHAGACLCKDASGADCLRPWLLACGSWPWNDEQHSSSADLSSFTDSLIDQKTPRKIPGNGFQCNYLWDTQKGSRWGERVKLSQTKMTPTEHKLSTCSR